MIYKVVQCDNCTKVHSLGAETLSWFLLVKQNNTVLLTKICDNFKIPDGFVRQNICPECAKSTFQSLYKHLKD